MAYRKLSAPQLDKMWFKADAQHHAYARLVEEYVRKRLEAEAASPGLPPQPASKKTPAKRA